MKLRIFLISLIISVSAFLDVSAQFVITDVYPKSATPGYTITVHGYGYPNTTYTVLKFLPVDGGAGIEATITSSNLNKITATVPGGLNEGNYRLEVTRDFTDDTLQAISPTVFTVLDEGGYFGQNGSNVENLLSGGQYSNFQSIDFNSNGYSDFVYANFSSGKVYWAENDGNDSPSFTEHEIASLTRAQYVKAADIDLDGDMDVVVTQNNTLYYPTVTFKLYWYENDGTSSPSFTQHEIADFSGSSLNKIDDMVVLDFDSDGYQDVVVSTHDDKEILLLRNNSGASSHFSYKQVIKSFPTNYARRLRVGDMNGDGQLDIVYATLTEVGWIKPSGGLFTSTVINNNEVYNSFTLHLSDIDNDGDVDVLADRNTDKIYLLESDGASVPNFTLSTITDNVNARKTVSGDMDADGDTDLILRNGNNNLTLLINDGNSPAAFSKVVITDGEYDLRDIQLGNINNDGGLDIIFSTPSSLDYYKNIDRPNVLGQSVSFDGDGDYISVADDDALDLNNQFTIEAWIKPTSIDADYQRFLSKSGAYGIGVNNNTIRFTTYGVRDYDLSYTLQNDTWVHIATVMDASNTVTFYVNGQNVGSISTGAGGANYSINSLSIGSNSTGGEAFEGLIDEVRIWNDDRTQEEIQTNMYQSLVGDESDLLAYYSFDGDGATAIDFTSNTFDGTFAGNATRDYNTHPYGAIITGNEGWRMMSAPVSGVSYGALLDTLWTQGFTGADAAQGIANVQIWDESTQSFSRITNANDIPSSGQGFITYVYDDDDFDGTADDFPKNIQTDNTQHFGSTSPSLSFTDSGILSDDGWNLVGNPYGATIDWDAASGLTSANLDASFYVWSDSANGGAGDYLSWNGTTGTFGSGKIAPWQGFWVKANTTSPSLTLTDDARNAGGVFLKKKPASTLSLTLDGDKKRSSTVISFQGQTSTSKDRFDAYKLHSLNTEYLSVFTQLNNGAGLDINALPLELEDALEIPLGMEGSNLSGDFELKWNPANLPSEMNITLRDTKTGTEIDLREASSYAFKLEAKTKASTNQKESSPKHGVFAAKVVKAKSSESGTRFVITINSETSVSNEPLVDLPRSVELQQNYPNPFNPSTSIAFGLPQNGKVTLEVFDVLGRKVATLLNGQSRSAGRHTINFDASSLSSGMYIYRLQTGSSVITKKLTLIK